MACSFLAPKRELTRITDPALLASTGESLGLAKSA